MIRELLILLCRIVGFLLFLAVIGICLIFRDAHVDSADEIREVAPMIVIYAVVGGISTLLMGLPRAKTAQAKLIAVFAAVTAAATFGCLLWRIEYLKQQISAGHNSETFGNLPASRKPNVSN